MAESEKQGTGAAESAASKRSSEQGRFRSFIEDFLVHLRDVRALSENTVRSYAVDLDAFASWCERQGVAPLSVSHRQLRGFLMELTQARYSSRTINRRLSALRTLYRWLVHEGHTKEDAAAALASPKLGRTLPRALSDTDVNAVLELVDASTDEGVRDKAFLELLYATGARISEVSGLDIGDIDFPSAQVRLVGKGDKERIVPVYETALSAVRDYLQRARPTLLEKGKGKAGDALFISVRGNRMSAAALRDVFERYVRHAGLDSSITPHAMRHSYATELLGGGADLRSVQELLGHESLSTTQIYTHLSVERLKEATRQAHPRSDS